MPKNTIINFWQDLPKPFFALAPMEAVTDVVFRHVISKAARPDLFFTEFTNASSFCSPEGIHSTRGRLTFTDDEQPIVAQIWGSRPDEFAQMSQGLAEMGFSGIDINMGCPDKAVLKSGAGCALMHEPELSSELIAAAKTGGLPVSVKTRLGDIRPEEWSEWLESILQNDIANLTIHLRTRKEMSKVPAHHELIPDIKILRDKIAPQTLLTINGDIRDRQHGEELVAQYGIDGIMIARGIFANPFAFIGTEEGNRATTNFRAHFLSDLPLETHSSVRLKSSGTTSDSTVSSIGDSSISSTGSTSKKNELIDLLKLHLDLHDKYEKELGPRKFEPLKRFFKIYIRDFPGASELRVKLMDAKSTDEVRRILNSVNLDAN